MRMLPCFSVALTLCITGVLSAEDRAATAQLPGALAALGLNNSQVATVSQAHKVRGQGGNIPVVTVRCAPNPCTTPCSPPPPPPPTNCPPPPNCPPPANCQPCGTSVSQSTSFVLTGNASGQVVLVEGAVGQFQYTKQGAGSTTVIQGSFGGLSGNLGTDNGGNLQFSLAGKALQETVTITGGQYTQVFSQSYRR